MQLINGQGCRLQGQYTKLYFYVIESNWKMKFKNTYNNIKNMKYLRVDLKKYE